jgi:outer membrane protein assembly factor BamB
MGTADYMAPEQVTDSHSVDIRADIYSLGCTLYRLLAGRPPFSGAAYPSTFEKMMGHARDPIPPIRELRADIPEGLVAVLDRMLAKKAADRFGTPGDVAAAVAPFAAGSDLPRLLSRDVSHNAAAAGASFSIDTDVWRSSAMEGTKPSGTRVRPGPRRLARWLRHVPARRVGLVTAAAGVVLFSVVVLIQKGRGPVTRLEAPDGSNIRIHSSSQLEVNLPETLPVDETASPPQSPLAERSLRVLWQIELREAVQNAITRVSLTPDGKHLIVFHNTASPVARVEKIDAQTGQVLWKRRKDLGGGNSATGWVDQQGNLYLTSVPYPVSVEEGRQNWRRGDSKIWKYDPELQRELWQYQEPGKGFEYVYSVLTDRQGSVFAAGYTGSQVGEGSRCVKLTANGSRVWDCLTSYGDADAYCEAIAVDSQGNLFRAGHDNPGNNAFMRGRILGHRASDGSVFLDVAVPEASSTVSGIHVDVQGGLFAAYTYDLHRDRSASNKEKVVVARLDREGRFVWRKPLNGEGMYLSKGALLSGGPQAFYIIYRKQTGAAYFPGLAEVSVTGDVVWMATLDLPAWVPFAPATIDLGRRMIYLGLNHVDDYRSSKVVAVALPEPGAARETPSHASPPAANATGSKGK